MRKLLFALLFVFMIGFTSATLTDNLKLYYAFEEGSGTTTDDLSSSGNNGNVMGTWKSGLVGNYAVNGTGPLANTTGNLGITGASARTINFWMNATKNDTDAGLMIYGSGAGGLLTINMRNTGSGPQYSVSNGATTVQSTLGVSKNKNMVTITYNGTGAAIYVNSVQIINQTMALNTVDGILTIGETGSGPYYGKIDDIGIWNVLLSKSDIDSLYNGGNGLAYPFGFTGVTLTAPSDNSKLSSSGTNFTANYSISGYNMTNATYFIWNTNGSIFNRTTVLVSGNYTNSTTIFIDDFSLGTNYLWNVRLCGINATANPCIFAQSNYSFYNNPFTETSVSYNLSGFETSYQRFILNINANPSVSSITGRFYYEGNKYLATVSNLGSGSYSSTSAIDLPINNGTTSKNFFWELITTLNDGTVLAQNTSTYNQSINVTHFALCNSTLTTKAVNFTIHDESNITLINSTFKSTFSWYLGTGTVKKNLSASYVSANTFNFCINPNETYVTSSDIDLSSSGYSDRSYSLVNKIYTNQRTDTSLYLLNTSATREIIIEAKDTGYKALDGYTVEIYRKYPETGLYTLVESQKTDIFGQFVAKLIENDVRYKFKFYNPSGKLIKETGEVSIACRSSICIVPFIIEDATDPFSRYKNITGYEDYLTFNNNTNLFILTWNDNSGDSSTHRLEVTRYLMNGTSIVCNSTSNALSGSLSCSVGSSKASYVAQGFRIVDGVVTRKIVESATVGNDSNIFGTEGLIWSFVLLFTLVSIGVFNPPIGIILYITGFLMLGMTNIIYINPAIFVAELVIGVLFIWAFRN